MLSNEPFFVVVLYCLLYANGNGPVRLPLELWTAR